jgi:hypothetical protein
MGTPLPVALTKKCDENTKWAKQDTDDKHGKPLALLRANHARNYAE